MSRDVSPSSMIFLVLLKHLSLSTAAEDRDVVEDKAEATESLPKPINSRAARGAGWVLGAQGAGQAFRFVAHLIVARLVAPEAFGLMLLVATVLEGAQMLTDLGLHQVIPRSERGDEPEIQDAVWTLGVLRGALLGVVVFLLAPAVAALFEVPALAPVLRVGALVPVLEGLQSVRGHVLTRRLEFKRHVLVGLSAYVVGVIVLLTWALIHPTVWALLAGRLAQLFTKGILSFTVLPGRWPAFRLERWATREIHQFGGWILFSTAISFVAAQGDRVFLGLYLSTGALGAYAVAQRLKQTGLQVYERICRSVLIPAIAETMRCAPDRVHQTIRRLRRPLDAAFVGGAGLLAGMGPLVVRVLYDERYQAAGWMLHFLGVHAGLAMLADGSQATLLAAGHSRAAFHASVARTATLLAAMPLGHALLGIPGVLLAVACSEGPALFALLHQEMRHGLFDRVVLLRAGALFGIGVFAGGLLLWGLGSAD